MRKEITNLLNNINSKFGMNAVRLASDIDGIAISRIPSGSISLDIALGGGIPVGRLIQIAGAYSACKSALAYHIARNAQRKLGKKKVLWDKHTTEKNKVYRWVLCPITDFDAIPLTVALIQSETHSYSNDWAESIGLDIDNLIFVQPDSMEEALEIAIQLQKSGEVDLIIHDSYAAYIPAKALDTSAEETYQMGLKQKAFGDYHGRMQAVNNKLEREGKLPTTVVAINQLREKIGAYGNPEYVPGGRSVGYTISVEVRLRKGDAIKIGTGENSRIIGQTIKFKIEKNKTHKPYLTGEFDFYFDDGGTVPAGHIDNAKELIVEAICYGIIEKAGSWMKYNGGNIAQGADKTVETVRNNPELFEEIKDKVMKIAFEEANTIEDRDEEEITEDEHLLDLDFDTRCMPPKIVDSEFEASPVKKAAKKPAKKGGSKNESPKSRSKNK